ncbi:MAG: ubiquitin-binding protein cue5 [Piccolia ochrophora]|nr:MAG: ubiquitin-binding protein cue5 [Piccolia ochrophora]
MAEPNRPVSPVRSSYPHLVARPYKVAEPSLATQVSPLKPTSGAGAESPTTARELDFEDDPHDAAPSTTDTASHHASTGVSATPVPGSGEDVAPPKPRRPMSPQQQAESTLKEAFPGIEATVVRAVLTASGGKVEPAFNALLGMSDPDAQNETPAPPQPPRPTRSPLASDVETSTPRNQLDADEMYARQLAEHYSGTAHRGGNRSGEPQGPPRRQQTGLKPNELYDDKEHSFIDDDLPVIKENLKKSFFETQTKVNKWVTDFRKKIDGEEDSDPESGTASTAQGYNSGPRQQSYGPRRSSEHIRRSTDRERDRYDADPKVLGDDFANLELRDDEGPPRRPARPVANPDLFKSTPPTPPSGGRRVSFQEGPPEEIKSGSPRPINRQPSPGTKQSKWQPMASVEPTPLSDADPFSLGDSDDDREARSKDLKSEDTERLKKAAAEAMADDIGPGTKKRLEPNEQSGTKDKEAEETLTGK